MDIVFMDTCIWIFINIYLSMDSLSIGILPMDVTLFYLTSNLPNFIRITITDVFVFTCELCRLRALHDNNLCSSALYYTNLANCKSYTN